MGLPHPHLFTKQCIFLQEELVLLLRRNDPLVIFKETLQGVYLPCETWNSFPVSSCGKSACLPTHPHDETQAETTQPWHTRMPAQQSSQYWPQVRRPMCSEQHFIQHLPFRNEENPNKTEQLLETKSIYRFVFWTPWSSPLKTIAMMATGVEPPFQPWSLCLPGPTHAAQLSKRSSFHCCRLRSVCSSSAAQTHERPILDQNHLCCAMALELCSGLRSSRPYVPGGVLAVPMCPAQILRNPVPLVRSRPCPSHLSRVAPPLDTSEDVIS